MVRLFLILWAFLLIAPNHSYAQDYYNNYSVPQFREMPQRSPVRGDFPRKSARSALTEGQVFFSTRFRFENLKNSGYRNDSTASTLRTTLGYETKKYKGFSGFIEVENIANLAKDTFYDGQNGETARPLIADPDSTEINQAYLHFKAHKGLEAQLGRFEITLGNERFISNNPWRQNHQSFDGFLFKSDMLLKNSEVLYGYLVNVNTFDGNHGSNGDMKGDNHLLNILHNYKGGTATGYAYLLDFNNQTSLSTQTLGINFSGTADTYTLFDVGYDIEFAMQSDYGSNPNGYDVNYFKLEPNLSYKGFDLKAGLEILESDGVNAFITPLANTHKFNGFTDQFVSTPANGLQTWYLEAGMAFKSGHKSFGDLYTKTAFYSFQAENGNDNYGSEWSIQFSQKVFDDYDVGFLYASFDAEDYTTNAQKAALMVQTKF